jgi:hypothetical protein
LGWSRDTLIQRGAFGGADEEPFLKGFETTPRAQLPKHDAEGSAETRMTP